MKVSLQPELPRLLQRVDDVGEGCEQRLGLVLDAVLGAQGLYQGRHLVVVVSWHAGEEVVFNLEIEVAAEPVVEG